MMIQRFLRFFDQQPKPLLTALGVVLVILIAAFDLNVGPAFRIPFFYLAPIALVSWFVGGRAGVFTSILCTGAWLVTETVERTAIPTSILYWHLLARGGVLALEAITLAQLRAKMDSLAAQATRDQLTGLPNRQAFYELAARQMGKSSVVNPLTLVYLDVGGFDWINHRYGYITGDHLMCALAQALKRNLPQPDLIARVGGTTFAVLLPNMNLDPATALLEKLQEKLREERKKFSQPIIFSISAMTCARSPGSFGQLMQEAETRMRRTKGIGQDAFEIVRVDFFPLLN